MTNTGTPLTGLTVNEFRHILLASGWFQLAPFQVDIDQLTLTYPFDLPAGHGILKLTGHGGRIALSVLNGDHAVSAAVATEILSLNEGLAGLKSSVQDTEFSWIAKEGFGRYLRGATLFEDCYKIILTTNTNWPRSLAMVRQTVAAFGRDVGGLKAFPRPEAFAGVSLDQLKKAIGCGYRAAGLLDLCRHALQDPGLFTGEDWRQLPAEEFIRRVKAVKGLGPMCVSYLCRFYGKPGDSTIDSWVVGRCHELFKVKADRKTVERFIRKRYAKLGDYAATVFWFEITRFWHERAFDKDGWWK